MKDRLRKKIEKRERRNLHELLDFALRINGLDERKREKTGNRPTTFFRFSGHVGTAEVTVHENGWTVDDVPEVEVTYATARWLKSCYKNFGDCRKQMAETEKRLENHEVSM